MNIAEVMTLVDVTTPDDPAEAECFAWIRSGRVKPYDNQPGRLTANLAFQTFTTRRMTIESQGILPEGIGRALDGLGKLEPTEPVALCSFSNDEFLITVFIAETQRRVVGCVRIPHRRARE